jgi:NADH-quinone oxidoreductase subunit N
VYLAQAPLDGLDVAWSSFAPELAPTAAALVLLLVAVAGHRKLLVAVPTAVLGIGLGVWLVTQELVVPGARSPSRSAPPPPRSCSPSRAVPSLIQAWGAGLSLVAALVLTIWQYAVGARPRRRPASRRRRRCRGRSPTTASRSSPG